MRNELNEEEQIVDVMCRRTKFFKQRASLWASVASVGRTAKVVWVSDAFKIVGLLPATREEGWSVGIIVYDPDQCAKNLVISLSELACEPEAVIGMLAHHGFMVSPTRLGRELFAEFLQSATQHTKVRISVRSAGYQRIGFIVHPEPDSDNSADDTLCGTPKSQPEEGQA
jgi:hypothetical protein